VKEAISLSSDLLLKYVLGWLFIPEKLKYSTLLLRSMNKTNKGEDAAVQHSIWAI
jgi:hypothetical protein